MNTEIEKQLVEMIGKFKTEIDLNESIAVSINNLYGKASELKNAVEETSKSIQNIYELFELKEFENDVATSLESISKANEILGKVRNDMISIKKSKEEFEKCSKEIKKESSRIFISNEERKEVLEGIRTLLEETSKIKKESRQSAKKVDNMYKDVKSIKEKFDKLEEEAEKDDDNNEVNISKESIKKIVEELEKTLENVESKEKTDKSESRETNQIASSEAVISKESMENLIDDINDNTEECMIMVKNSIEEENEKILKSQGEIKDQIEILEKRLTFAIEHKTEEIINKRVNAILTSMLSGINE